MTKRTDLMRLPSTNYKTTKHCVAYLDMLGTKGKICEDNDSKFLNYLNMIYYDAINQADWLSADKKEKVFVKIFSDNILLAIETEDDATREENITTILNLVANICKYLPFRLTLQTNGANFLEKFFLKSQKDENLKYYAISQNHNQLEVYFEISS